MARQSSKKGQALGHRDIIQARLGLELLRSGSLMPSSKIYSDFYEGHISRSSLHKTLKRDRDLLASEGIYLEEVQEGTAKSWRLDADKMNRRTVFIDDSRDKEAQGFAVLLRALLSDPELPNRRDLGFAIARMARRTGAGTKLNAPHRYSPNAQEFLPVFAQARYERRPVEMAYQAKADAKPEKRTLKVYGLFTLTDQIYVVGLRVKTGAPDEVRTFNLERVTDAQISDVPKGSYEIPEDFDIEVFRKLPFEIGSEAPFSATFYFQRGVKDNLDSSIKRRSTFVTHQGGSGEVTFNEVRNVDEAARWAIRNRAIPLNPPELVERWESILEEERS